MIVSGDLVVDGRVLVRSLGLDGSLGSVNGIDPDDGCVAVPVGC